MKVGIPSEIFPNELRVAATPKTVKRLQKQGFELYIQHNAGVKANFSDKEFEEALQLDPDNDNVLNNYAYYLALRKQNLSKAEKLSKRSIELSPNNVSYMDTFGWILFQQEKYSEAKIYFEKALDKGGFNRPAIVEHLGDVFYKLNQPDKALENWNKSKELGNTSDLLKKKIADKKYYE